MAGIMQKEEKKLAVMKQIQREKFGAEEENVQLGGRVHVLRDEVQKLEEVMEDMKLEVAAKTQELQDLQTQSSSLRHRKEQFELGRLVTGKDLPYGWSLWLAYAPAPDGEVQGWSCPCGLRFISRWLQGPDA